MSLTSTISMPRRAQEAPRADTLGTSPRRETPTYWLWLAACPVATLFILSNSATPLYASWQREMGFTQSTLTGIFSIYVAGLVVSLLVCGPLSDRVGRKPILLPALAVSFVSCLVFLSASSVPALLTARLLAGLAVGAIVSSGMAAVADIAGTNRRKTAALLSSSAMVLGSGVGTLFSGVVAQMAAAPAMPVFGAVLALVAVCLVLVVKMPLQPAAQPGRRPIRLPGVPRTALSHLALGVSAFAPGLSGTSFLSSLGPSLLYGITEDTNTSTAGTMIFLMFASATVVQFAAPRSTPRSLLAAGATSTVLGMAALLSAAALSSQVAIFLAAALVGAGQGAGQLAGFMLLNVAVPASRLAEANSALGVGAYLPAATLSLVTGRVSDSTSIETGAITLSVVLMVAAACSAAATFLFRHRLPRP
ncbi:MFS transporter [Catellatospora sp. NPDC049133]|jgi:MFS family permease|uniref:MFS transporter n=1 Tax=Catellatospora sp. NPDC049133 TaxID=3155499 RepID=UPI0033D0C93D